jgi:hypothetical protein
MRVRGASGGERDYLCPGLVGVSTRNSWRSARDTNEVGQQQRTGRKWTDERFRD